LENWGVDVNALKAKTVKRVFRAWVGEWEKECIKDKDAVAEVRLLEKYKGLAFFDPEDKITYTIESKNMEWFRASKKKGIDDGWYVVATSDDDDIESFMIEDELYQQIVDTPHTATEKIVVVIVRNEANYRSAHVWPPYAYSLTYSKTY
jgi:hypothetical protein